MAALYLWDFSRGYSGNENPEEIRNFFLFNAVTSCSDYAAKPEIKY